MLLTQAFKFPTTIVCVDDDQAILDKLSEVLSVNHKVKCFLKPEKALEFLDSFKQPISIPGLLSEVVDHEYFDTPNHTLVDLDISNIIQLAKNPKRHNQIAVLVLDYAFGAINGLEFCEKLQARPFKRILLTSELDYINAVGAFNRKAINCYVPKSSENFVAIVAAEINLLEQQYFSEYTASIIQHLELTNPLPISDPVFNTFFNNWLVMNQIKEYYLIDKNGSYLLIDHNKKKSIMLVYTDRSLDNLIDSYHDEDLAKNAIPYLKSRQKIPFFGLNTSPDDIEKSWDKYLHPAKVVDGKDRYYWSVVNIAKM